MLAKHALFALVVLAILGYLSVEVARFGRAQKRKEAGPAYPARRLVTRTLIAVLLVALLHSAVYWKPSPPGRAGEYLAPGLELAALLVLIVADMRQVWREYRRDREHKEQKFMVDMMRLVRGREPPTKTS